MLISNEQMATKKKNAKPPKGCSRYKNVAGHGSDVTDMIVPRAHCLVTRIGVQLILLCDVVITANALQNGWL